MVDLPTDPSSEDLKLLSPNDGSTVVRERIFCEAYAKNGGDAEKAAIIAGYKNPAQTGLRLIKLGSIVTRISEIKYRLENKECEDILPMEDKIKALKKVIEYGLNNLDDVGKKSNAYFVIAAIAEANKMQGHYAIEKSIHANISATFSREELMNLVTQYSNNKKIIDNHIVIDIEECK